ncbi:cytochrome c oxidase subunit II [Thermoleophilia bacterium SCSIO 60948]|nr:cytochrome c oxidase subunit II [Thermoleophilia bacterium SCSIO 60948]
MTIFKLACAALVLGTITAVIMLIPNWNGPGASTAAGPIDTLLDVMIVISSYVFMIVMVPLAYALWRWRAKPGDESDGEPIHGNTRLEIAWTAIPTIIVLSAAIYSWIVLEDIEAAEDPLPIEVTAQQYAWSFSYPEEGKVAEELHVPVGQQIALELRTLDVIHSFWVPEWRIKRDLVRQAGTPSADIDDDVVVTPTEEGTFTLVCTELCGYGHATMRANVVVESEEDYEAWLAEQEDIEEPTEGAASAGADATSGEEPPADLGALESEEQ